MRLVEFNISKDEKQRQYVIEDQGDLILVAYDDAFDEQGLDIYVKYLDDIDKEITAKKEYQAIEFVESLGIENNYSLSKK